MEPSTREKLTELLIPGDELGAKAADQQQRSAGAIAEGVVLEIDPVRPGIGHRPHATNPLVAKPLPARSSADRRFTWNRESVFEDEAGWERAVETVLARLPDLAEFKGHLGDSPDSLADWFDANERARRLMARVMVYSTMSYSVHVGD